MYPVLKLKKGKESIAAAGHPWIFSGALERPEESVEHGSLVRVVDAEGRTVGTGTYSSKSSIAVRVFEFGEAVIDSAWFRSRFESAESLRALAGYGPGTETTGYRVVFGESDGVPGLVVDRYGESLVIQVSTAGLELLKSSVLEALVAAFSPEAVYERSDLGVRREEGLDETSGLLYGKMPENPEFTENGLKFVSDALAGQKTGFFLDQKDLRNEIRKLSAGREALNLFSYTGAAGIAALKGGAKSVLNVDSSVPALTLCVSHAEMNGFGREAFPVEGADIFQWLSSRSDPAYDLVMMDPPALIKSQRDGESGRKAYHFLNRAALRLVRDGGIFATSSCSRFLPEEDLSFILRKASMQSGVALDVLKVVRQSPDHPASVYFPESSYLKSFICRVRR